jgi:hypothetical protein
VEPDHAEVERRVRAALDELLREDSPLLEVNANERSITHKFAEYLQKQFPGWHVDCEYNRDEHGGKKLVAAPRGPIDAEDEYGRTVFPDIIIHRRGHNKKNLLVIEAKKGPGHPERDEWDKQKLEAFMLPRLSYRFALFVRFSTGKNRAEPVLEWQPQNRPRGSTPDGHLRFGS